MAEAPKKVDESKTVKPGAALKKADKAAHDATYTKDGDLRVRHEKPVSAVDGYQRGTADTGVSAKIHEPVGAVPAIEPADTVDSDLANRKPETVEVRADAPEGARKDGDISAGEEQHQEEVDKALDALDVEDTEAAKNSEESQAAERKRRKQSDGVGDEPTKTADSKKSK